MTRNRCRRVATVVAAVLGASALAASGSLAAPAATPKLVLKCTGTTLVATLKGDVRAFRSATFEFGAKRIVDRTKPFSVRIGAAKVTATVASAVLVYPSGQPIEIEATVPPRCVGGR